MKTLGDYFKKILNKSFVDSDGRVYRVESITHEVMKVVYGNGDETFLPSFLHYGDKRAYRFRLRKQDLAQTSPKYTENPKEKSKDYIEEHCCPNYKDLDKIIAKTLKSIKGK